MSALLNLVAWTWGIPPAVWVVQEEYPSVWWSAVTGVFDNWTLFVSLVLIFVMGLRKKKGIWSTPRPWTQPEGAVVRPMPMPSMVPQPAAPPGAVVPPMASPGMYYVPFYVPYYGAQPVWSANAPPPSGQDAPAAQPTYPQTAVTHGNAASPAPGA